MGASKTYNNAKRFYYWPSMFGWMCAPTADCLTCQNNKPNPKYRNEVPMEDWQNKAVFFRTIHIDHKGHLHPPSNRSLDCLLVINALFCFLMVNPVTNKGARVNISAVVKRIHFFVIPPSIVHDESLPSSKPTSLIGIKNWETTCDPKRDTRLELVGKSNPRINLLPASGGTSGTTLETIGLS